MAALLLTACTGAKPGTGENIAGLSADVQSVIKARGLKPEDVSAALKTYMPSGKLDDYLMFASGGQGGQVLVYGLPSMRLLKAIAVFTPEPWQGYGYSDATRAILAEGQVNGKDIDWGDTHHPALSMTNGDYDGQYLFINDKGNARVAVIDLKDLSTKQIVTNPLMHNDHGVTVSTNTEYIFEDDQYAAPLGAEYAPLDQYHDKYRGVLTSWKFDRQKGRIDPAQSFSMELPPYWQDLTSPGKLSSEGWVFVNSINTEEATGGDADGKPPFEAGTAQRDMDYMHVINWQKAAEVAKTQAKVINGTKVIPLDVAVKEGLIYLIPEPKSPHGVDVAPKGDYIVVSGKLDPHVTIYSWDKIKAAIAKGGFDHDSYGVPVLKFQDTMEAQVEVGLGPLHTQFDSNGYAYTSLFLDSAVARWTLGPPYRNDGWKRVQKLPAQYNVGHVALTGGNTEHPEANYLVSLNKWSLDRFQKVGPLHPQNLQLIDISQPGDKMHLLSDTPVGNGEPHYAEIVKADKVQAWKTYPKIGWDATTQAPDPNAPQRGQEKVVRNGHNVEVFMTAIRSHFTPDRVEVNQGDHVVWHITNLETAEDATHGFGLTGYNVNLSIEPGETITFTFDADKAGTYSWYCTEFCSALHLEMTGYLLVKP